MTAKSVHIGVQLPLPEAAITINKSRRKVYQRGDEKTVYFTNGEHFEIELYNPFDDDIITKIEINGISINDGGLLIHSKQRVFLERYLTDNKAFVFESMQLTGEQAQIELMKKLLKNHGLIKITFHKKVEKKTTPDYYDWDDIKPHPYPRRPWEYPPQPYWLQMKSSNMIGTSNLRCSVQNCSAKSEMDSGELGFNSNNMVGSIGEGGKTNQELRDVYLTDSFDVIACATYIFRLLPVEKMEPVEVNEIRQYCTHCSVRIKPTWDFCAKCGTKIE